MTTKPDDVAKQLYEALTRYVDVENPFLSDEDSCECRNGDGRDDDGKVCCHIQAARALRAYDDKRASKKL